MSQPPTASVGWMNWHSLWRSKCSRAHDREKIIDIATTAPPPTFIGRIRAHARPKLLPLKIFFSRLRTSDADPIVRRVTSNSRWYISIFGLWYLSLWAQRRICAYVDFMGKCFGFYGSATERRNILSRRYLMLFFFFFFFMSVLTI